MKGFTGLPPFFWKERGGVFRSQTMSYTPKSLQLFGDPITLIPQKVCDFLGTP